MKTASKRESEIRIIKTFLKKLLPLEQCCPWSYDEGVCVGGGSRVDTKEISLFKKNVKVIMKLKGRKKDE